MSEQNVKYLELLLSKRGNNKNNFFYLSNNSCLESFYNETKPLHSKLSDIAIINLVYLVHNIHKVNIDVIDINHLKIYLSHIKILDNKKTYLNRYPAQGKDIRAMRAELKTDLVLNLIKNNFTFEEQKELFNNALKTNNIKTTLIRLQNKEYLDESEIKFSKSIMIKDHFIKYTDLLVNPTDKLNEKIFNYIKDNLESADINVKHLFIQKYKESFSNDYLYEYFSYTLSNKKINRTMKEYVIMFSNEMWLEHWIKYSELNKKPLNYEISEEFTMDFFSLKLLENKRLGKNISDKVFAELLLKMGYNFEGKSLAYEYLSSIENKKAFIKNTIDLEDVDKPIFFQDRNINLQILSLERLIPPIEKIKLMIELNNLVDYSKGTNSISHMFVWDKEILKVFKSYLFEYCNDDLSIDDDMISLLIMKYAT